MLVLLEMDYTWSYHIYIELLLFDVSLISVLHARDCPT